MIQDGGFDLTGLRCSGGGFGAPPHHRRSPSPQRRARGRHRDAGGSHAAAGKPHRTSASSTPATCLCIIIGKPLLQTRYTSGCSTYVTIRHLWALTWLAGGSIPEHDPYCWPVSNAAQLYGDPLPCTSSHFEFLLFIKVDRSAHRHICV